MRRARRVSAFVLAPSLSRVVCAQSLVLVTASMLSTAGAGRTGVLVAVVAAALIPFAAVGGRSAWGWIRVASRFASNRTPETGVITEHTDATGRAVGLQWHSRTVTCTLQVRPPKGASTVLGGSLASTEHDIPLRSEERRVGKECLL